MKNQFFIVVAILLFGSCKKFDEISAPGKLVPEGPSTGTVENLGRVFTGTNVSWNLNPLDPNNKPLFTYLPNEQSGYCMLMIDNGLVEGATPLNPFRFVSVNLTNSSYKIIPVTKPDGTAIQISLGRIVRYTFGMDKKFYVATESSPDGGGHLVQYDPNTQKAYDLGKPFFLNGKHLDIFSLNVGKDSALYGGSMGGDGEVLTFRMKNNVITVDQVPLDNTSRYVTNISGDNRYTYAICGKNNWFMYAVDRITGQRKTLFTNAGSASPIDVSSNEDYPYALISGTHYKLNGFITEAMPSRPNSERVYFVPYSPYNTDYAQAAWDSEDKEVEFRLPSGMQGQVKVNNMVEDVYSSGTIMVANNKLYIGGNRQGTLATYTTQEGIKKVGSTSMNIYSMASANNTLYIGGYPKGALLEYTTANPWTVNIAGITANGGYATNVSNPKEIGAFQNADANGVNGSMILLGMEATKNGYLVTGGNNDRITASGARELSMGSSKNGVIKNMILPEFALFDFQTICLSKDSMTAFVGAFPKTGNVGKIYHYNPANNTIINSWNLPLCGDGYYQIKPLSSRLLIGYSDYKVFLFDVVTGQVTWSNMLNNGQKIYGIAIGENNSAYIIHMNASVTNFKIMKYSFDISNNSSIKHVVQNIAELNDADNNERTKPTMLQLMRNPNTKGQELYVSGLLSLYKVKIS